MSGLGYTDFDAVVRVFDGTTLSNSGYASGAVSALLRNSDTNLLESQAPILLKGPLEEGMKGAIKALQDIPIGSKLLFASGLTVVAGGSIVLKQNWGPIKSRGSATLTKLGLRKSVSGDSSKLEAGHSAITAISRDQQSQVIGVDSEADSLVITEDKW
ncbi:hypothetical protein ACXA45_11220 [Neomicrococcus lactis]